MNQTKYIESVYKPMLSITLMHLILVDMTVLDEMLFLVYIPFYHATFVSLILIWGTIFTGILLSKNSFTLAPILYSNKGFCLVVALFAIYFLEYINTAFNVDSDMVPILSRSILLFSLSCLIFFSGLIIAQENILNYLIKPYIQLVSMIAILGTFSWVLVASGVIDLNDWNFLPLKELNKDSNLSHNFYFPLYVSIFQHLHYTMFGFTLFGVAGFSLDPHIGAALVLPAFFLVNYVEIRAKFILKVILLLYLLISGSFTVYLVLFFIFTIHLLFRFNSSFRIILIVVLFPLFCFLIFNEMVSSEYNNSLFVKISDDSGSITKSLHLNMLMAENFFGEPISHIKHTGFKKEINADGSFFMTILFYGFYTYSIIILAIYYFKGSEFNMIYAYGGILIYTLKDPQLFFSSYINFMTLIFFVWIYVTMKNKRI